VRIDDIEPAHTLVVDLDIAKVALMALICAGGSMKHLVRIEVTSCRNGVRRAAVAIFVNVEAVRTGAEPLDLCYDVNAFTLFRESYDAVNIVALCRVHHGNHLGDTPCLLVLPAAASE